MLTDKNVNITPGDTPKETGKRKATAEQKVPPKRRRKVNTTATPKKCIQWINPFLNLIQNIAGHPTKLALCQYAHSSLLQLPLQSGFVTPETIHRYFEPPLWNTSYPVPLITHTSTHSEQRKFVDPILSLVKAKKSHSCTLNRMKTNYSTKKSMLKKLRKGKEGNLFPNLAFKVAEQMARDPDPWFSEQFGYDYYFTGSSMATVDMDNYRWIINTVGEKMDAIEMVQFVVDKSLLKVYYNQLERYELSKEHGPVFEVCWSESENGMQASSDLDVTTDSYLMIAVRRKHKIDVLLTNGGHDFMKNKIISSEVPFISCCFPQGISDSFLCTSDLSKKLKIWNYANDQVLNEFKLKKSDAADDCWTCVRPISNNYVVCLDRTAIRLFKMKVNLVCVLETPLSIWLWACERASCMEVCPKNKFLFIGTAHKLLVIRLINSQDSGSPEFQQIITFTHNLKHFPTMVKYGSDSNEKYYVWISSQLPGDTTICNFSKVPPKRFGTNNLPQKPFTVHESYQLARNKGKCLYPAAALKRRLQLFQSGLAVLIDSDCVHLLLQSSFGDIFHQQVIDERQSNNSDEIPTIYHSWMLKLNTINDKHSRPLATDFKNFHGFKKIITCTNIDSPIVLEATDNPFRKRRRWKQSIEQLHQYKDLLAPDMLSIWGYRPDVTREKQQQPRQRLSTDVPLDVTDRIANWLDTAETGAVADNELEEAIEPTTVEDISSDIEDLFQDEVEIVDDVKPIIKHDTEVEVIVPAVGSSGIVGTKAKDATKPNRRKYVKGF